MTMMMLLIMMMMMMMMMTVRLWLYDADGSCADGAISEECDHVVEGGEIG